ncbi:MAG TPA: thioredoxin-disulfide reductase [bacterium]|nr:thioredoxin-disulfide reductase [bacterium]
MEKEKYDVVIIGAGPGGLTCGLYCSRAGLSVLVLDRGMPGGQMAMTEWVDNYPGFPDGMAGADLGELMNRQAQKFGAEVTYGNVTGIDCDKSQEYPVTISHDDGTISAGAAVIATGANPRELGVPGEKEFRGRGVSYCAVCDGNFFQDQEVCVIGGGDSAVEEATYLSKLCKKVTIIHRRDKFRAKKASSDVALSKPNIEVAWNTTVLEVKGGDSGVTGIKVKDVITGEEKVIPCTGAFFYVGINPLSEFIRGKLQTDDHGFIITDDEMQTSLEYVYAIGDVRRPRYRQISTAVGDGTVASLSIERKFNEQPDIWRTT